jgi:hypothetical protein
MDASVPFLNRKSHFSHPSASVMLNADIQYHPITRRNQRGYRLAHASSALLGRQNAVFDIYLRSQGLMEGIQPDCEPLSWRGER